MCNNKYLVYLISCPRQVGARQVIIPQGKHGFQQFASEYFANGCGVLAVVRGKGLARQRELLNAILGLEMGAIGTMVQVLLHDPPVKN